MVLLVFLIVPRQILWCSNGSEGFWKGTLNDSYRFWRITEEGSEGFWLLLDNDSEDSGGGFRKSMRTLNDSERFWRRILEDP
jgi:hypothetical protein